MQPKNTDSLKFLSGIVSPHGSSEIDFGCGVDMMVPTHRGLHRFIPRHIDEIEIDVGDPIFVQKEAEDLWCEG